MKRIEVDDWVREKSAEFALRRPIATRQEKIRRRPRDPEEEEILVLLIRKRWERWRAEGRIREVAPRRYEFTWPDDSSE